MQFTKEEIKNAFSKLKGWTITKDTKDELRFVCESYISRGDKEFKFWFENNILTDMDITPGIAYEDYVDGYNSVQEIIDDIYTNIRIYSR